MRSSGVPLAIHRPALVSPELHKLKGCPAWKICPHRQPPGVFVRRKADSKSALCLSLDPPAPETILFKRPALD